ncbi:MAG TPA: hypothetical protein ACFCUC_04430 [Desulfobacterales bacterium]
MKKRIVCLWLILIGFSVAIPWVWAAVEAPAPFGFVPGKTSYAAALEMIDARGWKSVEYEKRQFKKIGRDDPRKGKNTFLLVDPRKMDGIKRILLFFDIDATLDAVMVVIDPNLFESVLDELNDKYTLVEKQLEGKDFSMDYDHVLFRQGDHYIELQRLSAHHVRLVYVEKLLYENYRDFLLKTYEPFRHKLVKKDWMKDL